LWLWGAHHLTGEQELQQRQLYGRAGFDALRRRVLYNSAWLAPYLDKSHYYLGVNIAWWIAWWIVRRDGQLASQSAPTAPTAGESVPPGLTS
jgi:hypothetical protein